LSLQATLRKSLVPLKPHKREEKVVLAFLNEKAEEVICASLLAVIVSILGVGVIMRFIFFNSFAWQEEVIRFLFVWLNYFGVSLGAKRGTHIRVLAFVSLTPKKIGEKMLFISDIIWVFFNLVVIYASIDLLNQMMEFKVTSPVFGINMFFAYLIIPVSMLLTTVRIFQSHMPGKQHKILG